MKKQRLYLKRRLMQKAGRPKRKITPGSILIDSKFKTQVYGTIKFEKKDLRTFSKVFRAMGFKIEIDFY